MNEEEEYSDLQLKEIGNNYYKTKDYKNSIIYYEKAINKNPNVSIYYSNLSIALIMKGEYKESIKNSLKSMKLDEKNKRNYLYLGKSYLSLKKFEEARGIIIKGMDV